MEVFFIYLMASLASLPCAYIIFEQVMGKTIKWTESAVSSLLLLCPCHTAHRFFPTRWMLMRVSL